MTDNKFKCWLLYSLTNSVNFKTIWFSIRLSLQILNKSIQNSWTLLSSKGNVEEAFNTNVGFPEEKNIPRIDNGHVNNNLRDFLNMSWSFPDIVVELESDIPLIMQVHNYITW